MKYKFLVNTNEALCSKCLKTQSNLNFFCNYCNSSRLISYQDLCNLNIAHIDCDAFFASVEKSTVPALKNIPIIISSSTYGIVTTACYQARKFGIYSTMPIKKALELCPQAKVITPNMSKYKSFSKQIYNILLEYTPIIEPASIDEYYLDFKGTKNLHKTNAYTIMRHIAEKIKTELDITVSVGLSYGKYIAKFASDMQKPDGFSIINVNEAKSILANNSLSRLNGIGKSLEKKLQTLNITTVKDFQNANTNLLLHKCGSVAVQLQNYVSGIDSRAVCPNTKAKSISKEQTFPNYIHDANDIANNLYLLAQQVSHKMKKNNVVGNNVTLKITFANKLKITRSTQLKDYSNLYVDIFDHAYYLLKKENIKTPLYLIGVGVKNLKSTENANYTHNFDANITRKISLEQATDRIRNKFGIKIIDLAGIQK